jgi:DNA/RNA-binding domain of Phe-tRNA-synthetase-like protein
MPGKDFRPAHEALRRRLASGKALPDINPLVNFYNYGSALLCAPVGAWDLEAVGDFPLRLLITRGDESFVELGTRNIEKALPGEIAYACGEELVTRHFVWRQAELGKVTTGTRDFFMVSEILPEPGTTAAEEVRDHLVRGLADHFGVQCDAKILAAGTTIWEASHVGV